MNHWDFYQKQIMIY